MTRTQQLITERFAHLQPKIDFLLAPLTYFKIGGPAEVFLELTTRDDIIAVVQYCQTEHIPYTLLAGASNVIIRDEGVQGLVIEVSAEKYELFAEKHTVRIEAGARTALFVRQTVDDGLTGLEYFLGVPGKIGGAIYNNAHYLTELIGQYVERVEALQEDGKVVWLSREACQFRYDDSRFHRSHEVILRIEFALQPGDKKTSLEKIAEATRYRAKTQPLGEPSSGCYFRNTPNTDALRTQFPQFASRTEFPTAFLIEQAGLKGTKVGGVEVSQKHSAFLINTGHGTSKQTEQLTTKIKSVIKEKYGVELQEEVFWL